MAYAQSVLGVDMAEVQRLADLVGEEPDDLEELRRLRVRPRGTPYNLTSGDGPAPRMRRVISGRRVELEARGLLPEPPSMSPEAIQDRLDEMVEIEELHWGAALRRAAFDQVACDQVETRTTTRFRVAGARR